MRDVEIARGILTGRLVLLKGENAETVRRTLIAINDRVRAAVARPDRQAVLLVYCSGHADGATIHLGRTYGSAFKAGTTTTCEGGMTIKMTADYTTQFCTTPRNSNLVLDGMGAPASGVDVAGGSSPRDPSDVGLPQAVTTRARPTKSSHVMRCIPSF